MTRSQCLQQRTQLGDLVRRRVWNGVNTTSALPNKAWMLLWQYFTDGMIHGTIPMLDGAITRIYCVVEAGT